MCDGVYIFTEGKEILFVLSLLLWIKGEKWKAYAANFGFV
jgi:hypothetical protein